jgi:hypothetical protein
MFEIKAKGSLRWEGRSSPLVDAGAVAGDFGGGGWWGKEGSLGSKVATDQDTCIAGC